MGLAFLGKKSWHPGTFKNREKVWKVEERQKELLKKEAEQWKKLQEERDMEDIKRMQVEAKILPESVLYRQDWIYEGGNNNHKTNEDYLTGSKSIDLRDKNQPAFAGETMANGQKPREALTRKQYEDFVLATEDPMMEIKKKELEQRREIKENPLMMREVFREKPVFGRTKTEEQSRSRSRSQEKKKTRMELYDEYIKKMYGSVGLSFLKKEGLNQKEFQRPGEKRQDEKRESPKEEERQRGGSSGHRHSSSGRYSSKDLSREEIERKNREMEERAQRDRRHRHESYRKLVENDKNERREGHDHWKMKMQREVFEEKDKKTHGDQRKPRFHD